MKRRLFSGILGVLALLAALPAAAQITATATPSGNILAGPYLVVDATSGEALLQRDAGAAWYPASLTKLMTLYLAFEELKAGRLSLGSPIAFSQHASAQPPSKLGVGPGGSIPLELAVQALVVRSANDAATALGEAMNGTEAAFARRMNDTARRLGMTATSFRNANGLPDPEQVTSARDLALLGIALLRDFPQYYGYFQTQEFMYGKHKIGPGMKFLDLYGPYADGMKTGFICSSGFNIVASAVRDGRRLIGVALGFRRADLRDEFVVRAFDEAYALKTGGARPKVWQMHNEGRAPAVVFPQGECGGIRYDMPGDAAWLGTFGDWRTARNVFDTGQADLAALGYSRLGKEYILPVSANKATRQAAIIADLEPAAAEKLCASYRGRKAFCEVKKPHDFVAPFGAFWR